MGTCICNPKAAESVGISSGCRLKKVSHLRDMMGSSGLMQMHVSDAARQDAPCRCNAATEVYMYP